MLIWVAKPDQAAGALAVAGDRRDDEHRVVELAHERGERLLGGLAVASMSAESYRRPPTRARGRIDCSARNTSSGS